MAEKISQSTRNALRRAFEVTYRVLSLHDPILRIALKHGSYLWDLAKDYSILEVLLLQLGSKSMMKTQFHVLNSGDQRLAMDFKKATQDESQMIAIAATILAQIAITALSLDSLSQAHWVARGFFTFSLVSSLVSVYYAANQYRVLGRCISPDDIRRWIRGIHPRQRSVNRGSEPVELPSVPAILTISAPSVLLSGSLYSFIIGFGVYLGYVWRHNLDPLAAPGDSRAVFTVYVVGVLVCYCVFFVSSLLSSEEEKPF